METGGHDEAFSTAPTHRDENASINPSSDLEPQEFQPNPTLIANTIPTSLEDPNTASTSYSAVPQHERVTQELTQLSVSKTTPGSLHLDETGWGKRLVDIQRADIEASHEVPIGNFTLQQGRGGVRIQREILHIQKQGHNGHQTTGYSPFSVRVLDWKDNSLYLRITIEGPPQSPYRDGIFHLGCNIPYDYPLKPPDIRFLTKVYHPSVDREGNICINKNDWNTALMLEKYLLCILSLMSDPEVTDPLVPEIAATYIENRELYEQNARKWTQMYATDQQSFPD